jgi:chaperonin GroEL
VLVDADRSRAASTRSSAEIENTDSDYDREKLQERLAKLAGGVAVIKVGAATEVELKERKHRIEDAVSQRQGGHRGGHRRRWRRGPAAAERQGPFGRSTPRRATRPPVRRSSRRAVEAPLKQIAVNAGLEGGVVVEKVRNLARLAEGLNAATGDYVDLDRGRHHRRRPR